MKIVYAGGGTGGHINPALAVADYVKERENDSKALFIGTKRGLETKLVPKAGYDIEYIDVCGFDRKRLWRNFSTVIKLIKSNRKCVRILKEFKPDAVVCTGGYVSGPVAIAAHKLGIPSLIHEQNVYPGLTVKGAEKYVNYVAVSFDETVKYMKDKNKCVVTGNPVRVEIVKAAEEKKTASSQKPLVLVFGGSLGAEKINTTMLDVVKKLSETKKFRLIFGTGERNFESVKKALDGVDLTDIKIMPYIDNMAETMAEADVVVARSGAITVSEIAVLAKPSILIPSPNVVRNHQEQNAREIERNNACTVITENELSAEHLYEKIEELIDNSEKRIEMGHNVGKLGIKDATAKLYDLVKKMTK